jgi:hypothetical protein
MKLRLPKRQSGTPGVEVLLVHFCEALDRIIPTLRTIFMIAGLIAAAARVGLVSDFLFATGLLLHFAISFENWWIAKRTH